MLPQAEVLFMLLTLGLYLYDSALLLHINEGVVAPTRGGGWRVRFGSSHLSFRGKELYVPSPFLPHRPEFRLLWGLPSKSMEAHSVWEARRDLFKALGPLVWGMALALFVLLPLGLFSVLGDRMLLLAIFLLYLSIAGALFWLGMKRKQLGMSTRRLGVLAFELLVCPPFAVNVIRRVSAEMPLDADLMSVARQLQVPADWNVTRGEFIARLDEQIDAEDENCERIALLRNSRQKLIEDGSCPA
jgi:hypothetical protein